MILLIARFAGQDTINTDLAWLGVEPDWSWRAHCVSNRSLEQTNHRVYS